MEVDSGIHILDKIIGNNIDILQSRLDQVQHSNPMYLLPSLSKTEIQSYIMISEIFHLELRGHDPTVIVIKD